jgi:hypothetical protein
MRITAQIKGAVRRRWARFSRTPFGFLVRLFTGRMFHGNSDSGPGDLDVGVGVMLILMAMPGLLISLLAFEKYGHLILFLRGGQPFNPFTATVPDEYLFIVLSLAVSGGASLWRWDSIFLDRRDFTNLVPLPVGLRGMFLANLCSILFLTALFTFIANAASVVLFPIAVVGSQGSLSVFLRFAAGHFVGVFAASLFSCFAVFALTGLLMALLPAGTFRRISHLARFLLAIVLFALLVSSFAVPHLLSEASIPTAHKLALLPPFSFLGLTQTLWGRGADPFIADMRQAAITALGLAFFIAVIAYAASFRRSFLRIPETPDAGPLPRSPFSLSPLAPALDLVLRTKPQSACYQFVARTLLRSETHLQILLGFLALGLVLAANALSSASDLHSLLTDGVPSLGLLSVPFILSYCVVAGVRFAFEIPSELAANWVFRLWLDRNRHEARTTARLVLLVFSLSWLLPLCFFVTLAFWGWTIALLHTLTLAVSTTALSELVLARFRKLPFACSYPPFKSHSGLVVVAYLFGFLLFTDTLAQFERWSLQAPWRILCFAPVWAAALAGVYFYRRQMLEMDQQLLFEELPASEFW